MKKLILVIAGLLLSGCASTGQYTMADYQNVLLLQSLMYQNNATWNAYDAQQNYNNQQYLNRINEIGLRGEQGRQNIQQTQQIIDAMQNQR